jgi:hypothetical protein
LSYKEDDLVRKQRLKDNLNQLLIEYKHEEEQQLKRSSKFGTSGKLAGQHTQRMSLDTCYSSAANKLTGKHCPYHKKNVARTLSRLGPFFSPTLGSIFPQK